MAQETTDAYEPQGIRLGVVRGVSYGLFGPPGTFIPQARSLGAGILRAYVYWSQVEPEPGHYRWDVVDALLGQLDGDEEVWITLCSSSPWATRTPTDFLPPSPALDLDAYAEFVRRVVRRCAGRVHYWQCDNEPSNTDLLWAGTADEYVAQLKVMYAAVKEADPAAAVVLGGCGYDVLGGEPGSEPWRFFEQVLRGGRDAFDLFDVHLYGDAAAVPAHIEAVRELMRAHGCLRPVVAGEYAAPVPFEFPEAQAVMYEVFAKAFADAGGQVQSTSQPAVQSTSQPAVQSTRELAARARQDTPERRAMAALYARMPQLPPRLQMFMEGCPPELEARRHRINCRQLVACTLQALAAGVRRTLYWNLAPEVPGPADPLQIMHLMFGKLAMLGYRDGELAVRHPAADTFALLTAQLADARRVTRVPFADAPGLYAFEVERAGQEPLLVLWDGRGAVDEEDLPPVAVSWPWPASAATAVDAFGEPHPVEVRDRRLCLAVSGTPVFVSPMNRPRSHNAP
ncbi:hypothetical protein FLW53_06165 [Microbispora sp. SCL1-1]|uniref:Glycoside hydrolase family 5 domain-containing protein n=1 Tax=Microbispora hainanensis TaxID=568844 RepID=A0ABZ1SPF2_9ACTN|nr:MULTISPECIES: hypothetical protein [Microbispora]NJP23794.1 hypothetical protein [Microbispora sp. CL1-1]TQS15328.1 hypothetical protein FLW53_06165 [Microbispora sp. SCL1-1]